MSDKLLKMPADLANGKREITFIAGALTVSLVSSHEVKIKIGEDSVTCGIETLREVLSSLSNIRSEMEHEFDSED